MLLPTLASLSLGLLAGGEQTVLLALPPVLWEARYSIRHPTSFEKLDPIRIRGGGFGSEHKSTDDFIEEKKLTDTPAKIVQECYKVSHKAKFEELSFSKTVKASHSKQLTKQEWEYILHLLRCWDHGDGELSKINFRRKNKKGYKVVSTFKSVELSEDKFKIVRKISKGKDASKPERLVVHQDQVFDSIWECHQQAGHMKNHSTWSLVSKKYYNITEKLVENFVATCPVCIKEQPCAKPHKGAVKPIRSRSFRDRFQVDLIDFSKKATKDIYGIEQKWIMTLKDHFSKMVYLRALPSKEPKFVARELSHICGLIGFPMVYQTDNGNEVSSAEVVNILKRLHPGIITVTGRPRTPRDQGSVENANKVVKKTIALLEEEEKQAGNPNPSWVELLPRAMSAMNSVHGRQRDHCDPYSIVFGMEFNEPMISSINNLHKCKTVADRIKLLGTKEAERMESIGICADDVAGHLTDASSHIKSEMTENENEMKLSVDGKNIVQTRLKGANTSFGTTNNLDNGLGLSKADDHGIEKQKKISMDAAFQKQKYVRILEDHSEEKFVNPTLSCQCCLNGNFLLSVGEKSYYDLLCNNPTRWWESDFIGSFAALLAHDCHNSSVQVVHCNYPHASLLPEEVVILKKDVTKLVTVAYARSHFSVLEFDLKAKEIYVFDGLGYDLRTWLAHASNVLKRCGLVSLSTFRPVVLKSGKGGTPSKKWTLSAKKWVNQLDTYNCGPIACAIIWSLLTDGTFDPSATPVANLRKIVVAKFQELLQKYTNDLTVLCNTHRSNGPHNNKTVCPICMEANVAGEEQELVCGHAFHLQCILQWSTYNSKCPMCREDLPGHLLELPQLSITTSQSKAQSSAALSLMKLKSDSCETKRKLDMTRGQTENKDDNDGPHSNEMTPVTKRRHIRQESEKQQQRAQSTQARKMLERNVSSVDVSIGDFVTLKVDKRDRIAANPLGIVGVVYHVRSTSGVSVVTEYGVIVNGKTNKPRFYPQDQWGKLSPMASVGPKLEAIRQNILKGIFTVEDSPKITVTRAHGLLTGLGENTTVTCGCKSSCKFTTCKCRKNKQGCNSKCSCSGKCIGNTYNNN